MRAVLLLVASSIVSALSPCNSLRADTSASRSAHSNQTVGFSNVTEVFVFNGGDIITGDWFVMANATLLLQPGTANASAPIIIQGSIYLFDNATFYVAAGTQVSLSQSSPSQRNLYAFDSSVVGYDQAVVDHGTGVDLLQTWFVCHKSQASISNTDYSKRTRGSVAAFVYDSAALTVSGAIGRVIEVTLSQTASLTAINNDGNLGLNIYFTINEAMPPFMGWRLGGTTSLSQRVVSASGALNVSLAVSGTVTSLGLWLQPGAQIVLNSSQVLLFPSWGNVATYYNAPTGLQPCNSLKIDNTCQSYEDVTMRLGSGASAISVHFLKSEVLLWNAYFEGGGMATPHALTRSTIGETNCRDQANCTYTEVAVDGSGGYCIVEQNAVATFINSAVVTYTFIRNNSSAVFDASSFSFNGRLPGIRVQVEGQSTLKAINTALPTAVSTNNSTSLILGLLVAEDSRFLRASILPLPTMTTQNSNCSAITPPSVEMEVLPLSAPRSYLLEVFDDTQTLLAARAVTTSVPAFFRGGTDWGGSSPLAIPTTNGIHFVQITTTSGNLTAVARNFVNVTGCKNKGCPYDLIGSIFENCFLEDFLDNTGASCLTPCKLASVNLGRGWFNMVGPNRSSCVLNYPDTVGAISLPFGLNASFAASRLAGRDLCTSVSGAVQLSSSVLCVFVCVVFGMFF